MTNEVLRHIADKLQEELKFISDDLARGTAKDHGDYKYACGIIRGLMMATTIIADTAKNLENDDD
jgi:hypothetical protein